MPRILLRPHIFCILMENSQILLGIDSNILKPKRCSLTESKFMSTILQKMATKMFKKGKKDKIFETLGKNA